MPICKNESEPGASVEEVTLVHLPTGEIRTQRGPADGLTPGGADFMYRDGNYSCDCNRALFFARAGGTPEREIPELPCNGGPNEYVVTSVKLDGVEVYSEKLPDGPCDSAQVLP